MGGGGSLSGGGGGKNPFINNLMGGPKQPDPTSQAIVSQARGPGRNPQLQSNSQGNDQEYQMALENMMRRFGGGMGGMSNIRYGSGQTGGGFGGLF